MFNETGALVFFIISVVLWAVCGFTAAFLQKRHDPQLPPPIWLALFVIGPIALVFVLPDIER